MKAADSLLSLVSQRPGGGSRRRQLTRAQIERWLARLRGRRVAVLGDVILDEFLWGDATRISPEAPVPVVLLERQSWSLGGAANVAANVVTLGGQATLFSAVGEDRAGERIEQLLAEMGVVAGALSRLAGRPTTVKHRIFARNKHLLRFDREQTTPWPDSAVRALLTQLEAAGPFDAVVLSDYAKGGVTPTLARGVARWCSSLGIPWCVDPKDTSIRYRGATVLKPNLHELEALAGFRIKSQEDLHRAAARVLRAQRCSHLLVTQGREGMTIFGPEGDTIVIRAADQQVSDVTGAGDAVHAALGLGLAAGLSVGEAAVLANLAGAYVVTVPGIAAAKPADLLGLLR